MTAVSTNDERGKRELLCLQTLQNAFFYCGYIYRAVGLTLLGLSRRRCVSCTGMAGGPSRTPQGLAELPKNKCFWIVVLENILESPLDCKEIQPVHSEGDQNGISLEGMMLKLNLQYFGHLMRRVDSLEKTLMLGGVGGRRRRGRQRMRWLDGITDSMDVTKKQK